MRRRGEERAAAGGPRYPAWLSLPALAWYVAFFVCPLGIMAVFSFSRREGFSDIVYDFNLENYKDLVDPLYGEVFTRTLGLAAVGTIATLVIGFPLAYWLARLDSRGFSEWLDQNVVTHRHPDYAAVTISLKGIGETIWQMCEEHPGLDTAALSAPRSPRAVEDRIEKYIESLQRQGFLLEDAAVAVEFVITLALTASAEMRRLKAIEKAHADGPRVPVLKAYDTEEVWRGRGWYDRKLDIVLTGLEQRRSA